MNASHDICLCSGLRQAAHAMTELYDQALAPSGLRITMFKVLRRLSQSATPSISELAQRVGLDRSSLGRNLRLLEREGLVRFTDGADERSKRVQLTAKGRAALDAALPLWSAVQQRMHAAFGPETDAVARMIAIIHHEIRS